MGTETKSNSSSHLKRAFISYLKWGLPLVLGTGLVFFYLFPVRIFKVPLAQVTSVYLAYGAGVSVLEVILNLLGEGRKSSVRTARIQLARILIYINGICVAYFLMRDMLFPWLWLLGGLGVSLFLYVIYRSVRKEILRKQ